MISLSHTVASAASVSMGHFKTENDKVLVLDNWANSKASCAVLALLTQTHSTSAYCSQSASGASIDCSWLKSVPQVSDMLVAIPLSGHSDWLGGRPLRGRSETAPVVWRRYATRTKQSVSAVQVVLLLQTQTFRFPTCQQLETSDFARHPILEASFLTT